MAGTPLGDWGERLAAEHLERTGWLVLSRNFRLGRNEVDLVARRGEIVAFVEVKTRSSAAYGHPLEAILPRQRREIARVAAGWIERHGSEELVYRFDAICVSRGAGGTPALEHVEDAWRP
jgi:putative endonuclease